MRTAGDWARRRVELRGLLPLVYGDLPQAVAVRWDERHGAVLRDAAEGLQGASLVTGRVFAQDGPCPAFGMQLWVPQGAGPFPVLLCGDACWHYATDAVKAQVLARGYLLALFNRVELAADPVEPVARAAAGQGAIAWWAWAYQRCVDVLQRMDAVRADQIAVVGHSRGGKAALLAGATDERIALTSANNSGTAGAAGFRWYAAGAESLADLVREFPHWWGPRFAEFAGNEQALPWDQHCLLALAAPRALLTTEALGDLWANPEGTWQTHQAAREVYRFLHADGRLAVRYREGGHAHTLADWGTLLDFADSQFRGAAWPEQANPFARPGTLDHERM